MNSVYKFHTLPFLAFTLFLMLAARQLAAQNKDSISNNKVESDSVLALQSRDSLQAPKKKKGILNKVLSAGKSSWQKGKQIITGSAVQTLTQTDPLHPDLKKMTTALEDNIKTNTKDLGRQTLLNVANKRNSLEMDAGLGIRGGTENFFILAEKKGFAEAAYDNVKILSIAEDELQISNTGLVAYACQTDKGHAVFINQHPVVYNGMKIGLQYIHSFGAVNLSKDGHYGFVAILALNPTRAIFTNAVIVDGNIVAETGQQQFGYRIEQILNRERVEFGEGGSYHVNMTVTPITGSTHLSRYVSFGSEGLALPTVSLNKQRNCPIGTRCESNFSGQQIFTGNDSYLQTAEGNYLPSQSNAFRINNAGNIFTADLQIFNYNDANSVRPATSARYLELHDKYVFDFPCDKLFGFKPASDKRGVPDYRASTGTNVYHRIALSDDNKVAFFFFCFVAGVPVTAVVLGIPEPANQQKPASFIRLTKATTSDASDIIIDYNVVNTEHLPIHLSFYRAAQQQLAGLTETGFLKLKDTILAGANETASGFHTKVKVYQNTLLTPNTALPYVIVVADCGSQSDTTYFKKWLLGAVSHGFDRYAMDGWFWKVTVQNYTLPDWETKMAADLVSIDKYDDAIAFDWMHTCGVEKPGLAEKAGEDLAIQIIAWVTGHINHPGDVVDIHLIGHSRGTVVVSYASQDLITQYFNNYLRGSYLQLTLLDPHPANNSMQQPWGTWGTYNNPEIPKSGGCTLQGQAEVKIAKSMTTGFQRKVHDPAVLLLPGIKNVDVWWQHTESNKLCNQPYQEYVQNLWGMITDATIKNKAGIKIDLLAHAFVDKNVDGIGFIGHNEVPTVYQMQKVATGQLNRSVPSK